MKYTFAGLALLTLLVTAQRLKAQKDNQNSDNRKDALSRKTEDPGHAPVTRERQRTGLGTAVLELGNAAHTVVPALVAPPGQILGLIAGGPSLGDAAKAIVKSQGAQVSAIGQVISATNAATNGIPIVAAESIGGEVGKTMLTILTGPNRLAVEFAATTAIQTGKLGEGKVQIETMIAAPLAAAIRAAELQFQTDAKPIPIEVKAKLASFYSADVLNAARWTIGSVSISVPDLTNMSRKIFQDVENAVTVGHVRFSSVTLKTRIIGGLTSLNIKSSIMTGASTHLPISM